MMQTVAADKAASIVAKADALTPLQAIRRARELADLDREFTPEEQLEFCACMYLPNEILTSRSATDQTKWC